MTDGTSSGRIQREIRAIAASTAITLGTYTALVMALPAFDLWTHTIPSPGRYEALARGVAILVSALLAFGEVRRQRGTDRMNASDVRPSGRRWVITGTLLALAYLGTHSIPLGEWADLIHAVVYSATFILLTLGFVVLAKKAYDFAEADTKQQQLFADLARRTAELRAKAKGTRSRRSKAVLDPPAPQASTTSGSQVQLDIRFARFAAALFIAVTIAVTGFAALNQIMSLLPDVTRFPAAVNALGALVAVSAVGANYTSEFLERNLTMRLARTSRRLTRTLGRKSTVETGIGPVVVGVGCLIALLVADTLLGGEPSADPAVDVLVSGLQIVLFSSIAFGLWRLGVSSRERTGAAF